MLTRRQFHATLGAAASSLLLPRLLLRPDYDLHALAARWCAAEPMVKYDLTSPYIMTGHVYATDAKAMVRFEDDAADTDGQVRIPKETTLVWEQFWRPTRKRWLDLPQSPQVLYGDDGTCWRCLREYIECPACCGLGEWCVLPGDRSQRCDLCHGHGYYRPPSCPVCHGRYDVELPTVAVFRDKLIGLEYCSLLASVPGLRWNSGGNSETPILWQSDIGMAGMIMPRKQP